MSDDARSVNTKKVGRRQWHRVLVVSNRSSSDDDVGHPVPEPKSLYQNYPPRPLPVPSRPTPSIEPFPDARHQSGPNSNAMRPPVTTDNINQPPRSVHSNPSSPSSASSPAVDSTPPPSTPGLSTIQVNEEGTGTFRQEMFTSMVAKDRHENTAQISRLRQYVRSQAPVPSHERRYSNGGSRPATSPTVSTPDPYMPTPPHVYRSNPMEKVIVLVTTDAENFHIVDITGALTTAFIRERIFTKLQISDEDQSKFSIYRTEINQFAIGDALTDEELFALYKDRGDSSGTLKLLVSHSSAYVHEPLYDPAPTSTVNTIPPPVLPQGILCEPLRPNRKGRIRQGSQSSASEPHHAEVGYEASVSDDLDHGDTDPGPRDVRDYSRTAIHARALPTPTQRPSSPAGYHRSRSPGHMLSPERAAVYSPESHTYRPSPYHDIGASPMPGTSPQTSRFDGMPPLPSLPPEIQLAISETPTERERSYTNDGLPSSYPDRQWRDVKEREERDKESQRKRREREGRKDGRYPRGLDQETLDTKSRSDVWTIVPPDVPSSGYKKDRPTTPQEGRSTARFPITSPSSINPLTFRTGSGSGSGETSRRKKNLMVPGHWPVNWKHSMGPTAKPETKSASSAPSPSLMRHGAKSMTDMRGAYKHPQSLQPGRNSRAPPPPPPLPMLTRPSTGGNSTGGPPLPSASSTGEMMSAYSEIGQSPDVVRSALSPSGYTRQIATSYGSPSATNGYLGSPAQDPYPRPHSALGDSSSAPFTQPRPMHSPQNSETFYEPHRPPYSSTQSYSTTSYPHRDDATRFPPTASYPDQHSDSSSAIGDYPIRGPRTPPRSPVGTSISTATPVTGMNGFRPGSVPNDPPGAAFTRRGAIDEDGGNTIRPDDRTWVEGFIDENAAEGNARSRPKAQAAPTQQLPTPPPTTEMPASVLSTIVNTINGSQQHNDSSSESDGEGGTIWAKPPSKTPESQQPAPSQKQKNTRPPLAPLVFPSSQPPLPDYIPQPPPRTPRRTGAITSATKKHKDRISKFDNNFDMTWAPRPPPEVMYEKLEEYFPEHDLDKPVIEAPSGGTSPITTEAPAAAPVNPRFKHKKSIRVVAAEHKRQMDRTSRGDDSTAIGLSSRKRHTKLWGSKLEEVTTELGRGPSSSTSTSDSSPGGGVKPIFRWVRGELIGKGTYGRVYLALNATTGEMIAVKQVEMPRTASDKDDTRQVSVVEALKLESETLKDLDHPHIVQYLGFEETPTFLSIFLEYVPGGSIASCLRKHGRFDEEVTKSFTGQILDGLEYLHSRGILHRDLKADNILVETSGVCKMADFGISKRTDDINMAAAYTSMQGTVFWMAPEVINSKGKGYNSKIDIWSVGCVVFEMWTGQRPWSGQEAMAVLIHLYSTKQPPPVPEGIQLSALADDFRLKCFAADPDERPTAAELRKHPYLELQPGWVFNGFK